MASNAKFLFDADFAASNSTGGEPKLLTGVEIQELQDSAFESGVNEGIAREIRTTEHRNSQALTLIADRLREIADSQSAAMSSTINDAVNLTLAITRKITPALSQHQPMVGIEAMVNEYLHQLIDEPHIVVRVPEALIDELKQRIDEIAASCGFAGRVVLIPDSAMHGGDCRLEWADGGVTRSTDAILNEIESGVARALQDPAVLSGEVPDEVNQGDGPNQPGSMPGSSQ